MIGMIKQTAIALIIVFMLAALANTVYANAYLPIVATGGVHSAAIGYGQDIVISGNNWIQTTCADGATPTVRTDGNSVVVRCHEE
jgi:hypothetical protein